MATYSQKKLLAGIFSGDYSKFNLPDFLFLFTFEELLEEVNKGFGEASAFAEGSVRRGYADAFRFNMNTFSGAKTFQEVNNLSRLVFTEEGFKRPFAEFRELAAPVDDTYNKTWLKTEQDTTFGPAQGAEHWVEIEEDKEILPFLQYQTADDERVRHEHAQWDNLTFPVDHEFWDTRMPVNDFNCRCRVIQLSEGKTSKLKGVPENSSSVFNNNVGKTREIFTESHPYYKVSAEDQPLTKNNFGLGFV